MGESRYKAAGVDIDAAIEAVDRIKPAIRETYTSSVLADVGSFGGLFALDDLYGDPVLVSSIDGVGTKVKLASELGKWRGIGYDIVNHCANDILVQNARPLFFMDYVATSKLVPQQVAEVVIGIAAACKEIGCALLGGETAEMPGVYAEGAFDVVGAIVGIVDRGSILPDMKSMRAGDVLIGLPSSGPHTNGYTLIRQAIADKDINQVFTDGRTLADALLEPHRVYMHEIEKLQAAGVPLMGLAHITGGGLIDNVPRVLPAHLCARIDSRLWEIPDIFRLLAEWSGMSAAEAFRVLNMGVGMALIISHGAEQDVYDVLPEAFCIGKLTARDTDGSGVTIV